MSDSLRRCSRCILESGVPGIEFDERGICNYCKLHDRLDAEYPLNEEGQRKLDALVRQIQLDGRRRTYDCVVGVSGGVDSTYMLYLSKKAGLRPLAVHFDNGWDSEIAVDNIKKACRKLEADLSTYVVDWQEFRDLQLSFLKASTPDAEIPSDLGIVATLYRVAAEKNIR